MVRMISYGNLNGLFVHTFGYSYSEPPVIRLHQERHSLHTSLRTFDGRPLPFFLVWYPEILSFSSGLYQSFVGLRASLF